MTEEKTEYNEYELLAMEMNKALAAAKAQINPYILGKAKDMQLEKEDYRMLGTSLFIEANYAKRKSNGGDYSGPSTDNQQSFIARLIAEREGSKDIIDGFLDANDIKLVKDLTSSLASTLIDQLKALPKR